MRNIRLTKGHVTLVDDEDFAELSKLNWQVGTKLYAQRQCRLPDGRLTTELMHRRILGLTHGDKRQADHINRDVLDNRRENLRVVTCRGNNENKRNQSRHGPGVWFRPGIKSKPFKLQVNIDGKLTYLGRFATAEDAQLHRRKILETTQE